MKHLIIVLLAFCLFCLSASAQQSSLEQMSQLSCTQDKASSLALQYPSMNLSQLRSAADEETGAVAKTYRDDREWSKGKGLRMAGMIATGVGAAATTACIIGVSDGDWADNIGCAILLAPSAAIAVSGVVLWIVGNHKMKKVRLSYTGNGLAYNFWPVLFRNYRV